MSQIPPADHSSKDAAPAVAVPPFEVQFETFWVNNRRPIYGFIAAVLLFIVGREGWQYFAAQREQGVEQDFAAAVGNDAKLAAFAAGHAGHPLAGAAYLTLADAKYTAADYAAAADLYTKAQTNLSNDALLGRAKLGAAMSKLAGSDRAGGEAALKAISADATLFKSVRAEATYHLAALAAEAGQTAEVTRLTDEISKIDAGGVWAQRGLVLRATSGEKKAEAVPAVSFTPGK
ncbi:MAG: hypothetical protein HY302_03840 [Opitutae bacterium]|nr:hypothetical protein [Opitutae bacterium]